MKKRQTQEEISKILTKYAEDYVAAGHGQFIDQPSSRHMPFDPPGAGLQHLLRKMADVAGWILTQECASSANASERESVNRAHAAAKSVLSCIAIVEATEAVEEKIVNAIKAGQSYVSIYLHMQEPEMAVAMQQKGAAANRKRARIKALKVKEVVLEIEEVYGQSFREWSVDAKLEILNEEIEALDDSERVIHGFTKPSRGRGGWVSKSFLYNHKIVKNSSQD